MADVRTRFAPSPTGTPESIHLGFVIRALWNYAYAKKNGGQFVLRIEDTDQKRSRADTEAEIFKVLRSFGIDWDEGPDKGGPYAPYRQSERLTLYQEAARKLVENGYAYYDFEAPQREKEEIKAAYDSDEKLKELKIRPKARDERPEAALERVKNGEPYVVRAKIPEDRVFEYEDWILKKKVKFFGKEVPDMILLKSDGFPTYHLAVVVDDVAMKISHVFRGQEWISSTPIHLHVYEGLGESVPNIGHFSVILDPRTGKKFSKRDMTALFGVNTWTSQGYLPAAILNYLMLLGWAPKDNQELFTLSEFVAAFDQNGVQKANPTFNAAKLDWFNSQYLQKLSDEDFFVSARPFVSKEISDEILHKIVPLVKTRVKKLSELGEYLEYFYKQKEPIFDLTDKYKEHVTKALEALEKTNDWNLETINSQLTNLIGENNFKTGDFYMDLRCSIAGSRSTPPINESMEILGKDVTLTRLTDALSVYNKR